ncbi:hypothetical protein ABZS71_12270 [Streptomyces sp. NPDC005393]|uniref:hypothetical protein n=1 Tax=Streptomyces sp. NPDC005393 TaxID=3157041 RepID=UPI0033B4EAE9
MATSRMAWAICCDGARLRMNPLDQRAGWTSYLRPRLFGGRMVPSVVITGVIWASWHYPLAFIGYIEAAPCGP